MYSEERKAAIIKYLERDGKVSVAGMADLFSASRETIRRDLRDLEEKGVLSRTHGGAIPRKTKDEISGSVITEYPESVRGIRNSQEKERLCKEVASRIKDGDIVYIDNSTTCLYVVPNIPSKLHVTIMTNSLRILTEAVQYDYSNKTFFCLGGSFNPRNLSTYNNSLLPKDNLGFYPDKCILSCTGISNDRMITDGSIFEVATKHKYMESSTEVYLLADHTKIGKDGQFYLDDGSEVDYLITDEPVDPGKLSVPSNIKVIVAD